MSDWAKFSICLVILTASKLVDAGLLAVMLPIVCKWCRKYFGG